MNLQAAYVAFFSLFFNIYLSFMKFVMKRPDQEQVADTADNNTIFVPGLMGGEGSFEIKYNSSEAAPAQHKSIAKDASKPTGAGKTPGA